MIVAVGTVGMIKLNDMENFENDFNQDDRFKTEADKSLIYDSKNGADICMYFDEETKDWLLSLLNTYVD